MTVLTFLVSLISLSGSLSLDIKKKILVLCLGFVTCNCIGKVYQFQQLLGEAFMFFHAQNHVICKYGCFNFFLSNFDALCFSFPTHLLANTCSVMLNKSVVESYCLVPGKPGNVTRVMSLALISQLCL